MKKAGDISPLVTEAVAAISAKLYADESKDSALAGALSRSGFRTSAAPVSAFDDVIPDEAFWFEAEPTTKGKQALRERLADVNAAAETWRARLLDEERRAADYLLAKEAGFPAYLGGVFATALAS